MDEKANEKSVEIMDKIFNVIDQYVKENQESLQKDYAVILASVFLEHDIQLDEYVWVKDFLNRKTLVTALEVRTIESEYEHFILSGMYQQVKKQTFQRNVEIFGKEEMMTLLDVQECSKISKLVNLETVMENEYHYQVIDYLSNIIRHDYEKLKKSLFAPYIQEGLKEEKNKKKWEKKRLRMLMKRGNGYEGKDVKNH